MNRYRSYLALLLVIVLPASLVWAAEQKANTSAPVAVVSFDAKGLSLLRIGSSDILVPGPLVLQHLLLDGAKVDGKGFEVISTRYIQESRRVEQQYQWGMLACTYEMSSRGVVLNLEVKNTGTHAINAIYWDVMNIRFPMTPEGAGWSDRWPRMIDSPSVLPAVLVDWKTGSLAVCNEDQSRPVKFGLWPRDKGDCYAVIVQQDSPAIRPGESRQYKLSVRLGATGVPATALVGDIAKAFAAKHPSELRWDDRRPIASVFLATSEAGYKTNPRGWFMDASIDTTTPAGQAQFHDRLMKYADEVISNCKKLNAQGVIVWDVEGQEMPHAISYLGDPRILPQAAPEMDAAADEFFSKFIKAGLKTGVTVRPSRVVLKSASPRAFEQETVADPVDEMSRKIDYARKRWGCSIIYLDSNVIEHREGGNLATEPMPAEMFRDLARRQPGVLLIPEHETPLHWAYAAPYNEYRQGYVGTPTDVRAIYPRSFSVLRVVDGPPLQDHWAELVANVKAGDILLFRAWWNDPVNEQVRQIYEEAMR